MFAHKPSAWSRWRQQLTERALRPAAGSSARSLEQQVMHLALRAPRLVAMPGTGVRRMRTADLPARMAAKEKAKAERQARAAERRAARRAARKRRDD